MNDVNYMSMNFNKTATNAIRDVFARSKFSSQKDLANALHCDYTYLNKVLSGRTIPSLAFFFRLLSVCDFGMYVSTDVVPMYYYHYYETDFGGDIPF